MGNELINLINNKFKIDRIISFKGIKQGIENTNYLLKSRNNKFILTIFEKRVSQKEIPFFMKLMDQLNNFKINCPKPLKNKVFIASIDKKGDYNYIGGVWKNGFLRAKIREFGDFCVVADTINPNIKAVNIFPGKEIKNQTTVKCLIEDKESGIKKFEGKINGQWILMEYDHKRKLLQYDFNEIIKKGENLFTLDVHDMLGNVKKYSAKFYY